MTWLEVVKLAGPIAVIVIAFLTWDLRKDKMGQDRWIEALRLQKDEAKRHSHELKNLADSTRQVISENTATFQRLMEEMSKRPCMWTQEHIELVEELSKLAKQRRNNNEKAGDSDRAGGFGRRVQDGAG